MTSSIKETVDIIREYAKNGIPINKLRVKYKDFSDSYPKLFDVAVDPTFPLTFLTPMLAQLKALNNKETDLDSADKIVYGQLQKQYVDPVMDKLSKTSTTSDVDQ